VVDPDAPVEGLEGVVAPEVEPSPERGVRLRLSRFIAPEREVEVEAPELVLDSPEPVAEPERSYRPALDAPELSLFAPEVLELPEALGLVG